MGITNIARVTTALSNSTRIGNGETWATILTSWGSETRSWLAIGSLLSNGTRVSTSITNTTKVT